MSGPRTRRRNYSGAKWLEDEWWAAQLAGDEAADRLVELDDDVLPGPPAHRPGPAVQVVGLGAVVDPDPVADPEAGQGGHRPGGGQQAHPFVDDRAEHGQLVVEFPARDRLDHGLDQVDRGGRGAGR